MDKNPNIEYNSFATVESPVLEEIKPKYDNVFIIDTPSQEVYKFALQKANAFAAKYVPNSSNPAKSKNFTIKDAVKTENIDELTLLSTNDELFLEQFNSIGDGEKGIIITYNYKPLISEDEESAYEKWNNSRLLQILDSNGSNTVVETFLQSGGKKKTMKKTNKKVKVGKVERVVYVGTRGGQYIKMNGGFVSLSKLNKH